MTIRLAHITATVIEFISIGIIAWGVLLALFRIAMMMVERVRGDLDLSYSWLRMRRMFGETMLLGLQFLVAADIVLSICNPEVQTVALLAAVVVIRVVLSISLGKEIEGLEERDIHARQFAKKYFKYHEQHKEEKPSE